MGLMAFSQELDLLIGSHEKRQDAPSEGVEDDVLEVHAGDATVQSWGRPRRDEASPRCRSWRRRW